MARIKNPDYVATVREEILHAVAHMKASPIIGIAACLSAASVLAYQNNEPDEQLIAMLELQLKRTRERGGLRLS